MSRARRFLLVATTFLVAATGILAGAVLLFPYPMHRLRPEATASLRLVDRNGGLLRDAPLPGHGRATWVHLAEVAPEVILATLASEDHHFHDHYGVDARAVARALWLDARAGKVISGASTITMQLARLLDPKPRGLLAKLSEMLAALRIERALSKEQILEQYMNRAYYGNGAYGIEQAALRYFGKPAKALGLGESALLSSLPRAPVAYDPFQHLSTALARRDHILDLMASRGVATPEAIARARGITLTLAKHPTDPGRAPHFCDYVLAQLPASARTTGGDVHTTLDARMQEQLEWAVKAHVRDRRELGLASAAALILDAPTGAVLAMVGSPNYADPAYGQVNLTTTLRHPGSTLKPFLYALPLAQGDSPASLAHDVADVPSDYHPDHPMREHGPARFREALAGSYNLSAIHVLEKVGIHHFLETLRSAGLSPLSGNASDYGLGLALGSAQVRLLDLAAAYAFLVTGGLVTGAHGLDVPQAPHRVFEPTVSWLVMDMLADPGARRQVFGAELPVDLPFPVAAKTGTSGGFADTLTVIATREYVTAAWAGSPDGSGTKGSLAMWSAAPLARAALLAAADGRALTLPAMPEGLVKRDVCRLSGKLPGPHCPTKLEIFEPHTVPADTCDWHTIRGGKVRINYPDDLSAWAKRVGKEP
jgi:penicillin-binding protein 1C